MPTTDHKYIYMHIRNKKWILVDVIKEIPFRNQ